MWSRCWLHSGSYMVQAVNIILVQIFLALNWYWGVYVETAATEYLL